jgi:hypothetical protein
VALGNIHHAVAQLRHVAQREVSAVNPQQPVVRRGSQLDALAVPARGEDVLRGTPGV